MPRKGMRSVCFSPKISSSFFSPPSPLRIGFSPSHPSISDSVMDRTLEIAEPVIVKWDPETTTFARVTSLFYENRREAREFIKTVNNLQKAMHFIVKEDSGSEKLVRAQNLMQIAMKRLQKEFYQILSMNRAHLDPESVSTRSSRTSTGSSTSYNEDEDDDDVIRAADDSITEVEDASLSAMADLKLIAECMISSGYAKECLKIYKIIRKSIVDEGIYKLGVEKLTSSQIHKMDWESVELRIKNWLNAVRTAVKTLFNGERILSDHVFASSDSIRESCFAEITKDGATLLFAFPENVAKHSKKWPEKVFRVLDMYAGISNYWPEIDSIFSFESTIPIKSQALTSLVKLGEFVRAALHDFESAIQKDSTKSPVAGAGNHNLTIDAMEYLTNLADYSSILSDILADSPPETKKLMPESYFGFSDTEESPAPAISLKMAWLILVLLCKLDTKAKYYKDVSLAYLFLANNLQYVVVKVQTSNLRYILGDEWLTNHKSKIKQFAANYERLGWGHVIDSLSSVNPTAEDTPPEKVKETFKKFNASFEQAYKKQGVCVVPDNKLRDYIKVSIARKIIRLYREFYNAHRQKMVGERNSAVVVRYAPEDVGHHLSDLFFGNIESGSSSSFSSPSPSHSQPRRSAD
ncbi:hypothetical protein ABFS82_12G135700 [Erythranthe guttata]|uniref:Exocyst subunit Exo70 family protein n=1 Tax=Erythranthe guttata TaxID=4155 RepID=A0A022RES1_ERYGU|nr:PREDICTED: exocyst complex component EXO70A1-like [Erythranthe guttata]EYU38484.1 hypothetical protein MIMGU_mgv1a022387mg [Erythranthe guttata]|eukprot:XP_012835846.1 PREDICTED: exocyst complex component EXO70A1-like [Erythranthe guttata]